MTPQDRQDILTDAQSRQDGSAIRSTDWSIGKRMLLCLSVSLALSALNGCSLNQWVRNGFKVGPNYCKPAAPVASEWIDYRDPNIKSTKANLATWWRVFNDPALNDLVQTASRQNINLRVAGMRIMEARAMRGIAAGELFPQSQYMNGSYSHAAVSENVANRTATPQPRFDQWNSGFGLGWELDFWGRFRRGVEAADAELDASIENYDDVLVLLLAEVASSYVEMRTFQDRLILAVNNVNAQENALKIADDKFKNGAATQRDVEQARTVLEQTRSLVPQFEEGQRLANNKLCLLLGLPPQDLAAMGLGVMPVPKAPPEVAIGIPAELVRRRPDIRKAERIAAAQSAKIGIAESDFYPQISIVGTLGWSSQDLTNLYAPGSFRGNVGPAFNWNILNYGRIANNVRVQDARFQQVAYAYQEKVLEAAREAEDGIVKFLKSNQRSQYLDASANAAEKTRTITTEQYRQGVVDFTAVYIAESELSQVQDIAAYARGQIAQNLIGLYRALGGGWEMRLLPQGEMERTMENTSPATAYPEQRPEIPVPNALEPVSPTIAPVNPDSGR